MTDLLTDNEELCPSCGKFSILREDTGWCLECSKDIPISSYDKLESFLRENADHIEHYTGQGFSVADAVNRFRNDTRPRCVCCGVFIKRATRNSIFCRTNAKCRHASRRYVYLYSEKGHSKSAALAIVLSEL